MTQELDNFNELKSLYQQKKETKNNISSTEIKQNATHKIEVLKKKNFKQYFLFLATAVALVFINNISSKTIETSKLGFGILLSCSLYYAISKVYLNQKLSKISPLNSAKENLESLVNYSKLVTFVSIFLEFIYAVVLSIGVYLYMQPIIEANSASGNYFPLLAKLVWVFYLIWAFIYTFIIKRKEVTKEKKIIECMIQSLKENL
ncbi:conserved membrane hypothetical protein [Flavobacterium sp. 9AF]|uniref:hypothetical protein n=1 Tax=Flavobacterium sp. 9AF TaxID=2653142 RepID=UPI0012F39DD1|nr:hypothetical protein [Flavobacterium sp. 9AF]VXB83966.1 conserved membrane hypothetical protein [Flavobacterium sp. 9AF]